MLQAIYYNQEKEANLEICYPKRARLPKEVLTVRNFDQATRVWNIRTRKYIFDKLRGWVMQRKHAIGYSENHLKDRYAAKLVTIDRLLLTLMHNYESKLPVLAAKVAAERKNIEFIAPYLNSRYYDHYEEVILPIVEWCESVQDEINKQKQLN